VNSVDFIKPHHKRDFTQWHCPFVCLFVCRLKRVLVGHWPDWPSSAVVLAAVSGRSAAEPVKPVPNIVMAAGVIISATRAALTCFMCRA